MMFKNLCKNDNVVFIMASTSLCLFFYVTTIYLPKEYDDIEDEDY